MYACGIHPNLSVETLSLAPPLPSVRVTQCEVMIIATDFAIRVRNMFRRCSLWESQHASYKRNVTLLPPYPVHYLAPLSRPAFFPSACGRESEVSRTLSTLCSRDGITHIVRVWMCYTSRHAPLQRPRLLQRACHAWSFALLSAPWLAAVACARVIAWKTRPQCAPLGCLPVAPPQ